MTWKGWLAIGGGFLLMGFLLGRASLKPQPAEVKTVEVVKWRTVEHVHTLPGATVYLQSDGTTVITGPVDLNRESEGERALTSQSHQAPPPWHVVTAASLHYPNPSWEVSLTFRIGEILTFPIGAVVSGEGRLSSYLPTRFGAGIAVSF